MNREQLESFIMENYNASTDYPWLKYPNYEVFRHCSNQKWFALIMDVPLKIMVAAMNAFRSNHNNDRRGFYRFRREDLRQRTAQRLILDDIERGRL